jgi:hypothetical protein
MISIAQLISSSRVSAPSVAHNIPVAELLTRREPAGVLVQELCPIYESMPWRCSQRCWEDAGVEVFTSGEVPHVVTNDGEQSRKAFTTKSETTWATWTGDSSARRVRGDRVVSDREHRAEHVAAGFRVGLGMHPGGLAARSHRGWRGSGLTPRGVDFSVPADRVTPRTVLET